MATLSGSLDANILLRILLNDVPEQHRAVAKLIENSDGQFAVADTAVIETAFALEKHYALPRTVVAEAIEGLLSLAQLNLNRALFKQVLPLFTAHPKLSFEDCCLATYAALNEALPLWTFDRKLAGQVKEAKLVPVK